MITALRFQKPGWLTWIKNLITGSKGVPPRPVRRPLVVEITHYTLDGTKTGKGEQALCGHSIETGPVAEAIDWSHPRACPDCLAVFYRLKEINGNVPQAVR